MPIAKMTTMMLDGVQEQLRLLDKELKTQAATQGNNYFAKRVIMEMDRAVKDTISSNIKYEKNEKTKNIFEQSFDKFKKDNKDINSDDLSKYENKLNEYDSKMDKSSVSSLISANKILLLNDLLPDDHKVDLGDLRLLENNQQIQDSDLATVSKQDWEQYKLDIVNFAKDVNDEMKILEETGLSDSEMYVLKSKIANDIKTEAYFIKHIESNPENIDQNDYIILPVSGPKEFLESYKKDPNLYLNDKLNNLRIKNQAVDDLSTSINKDYYISKKDMERMEKVVEINSTLVKDMETGSYSKRHYYKVNEMDGAKKLNKLDKVKDSLAKGFDAIIVEPFKKMKEYFDKNNAGAIRLDKAANEMGSKKDPENKQSFMQKFTDVNMKFMNKINSIIHPEPTNDKEKLVSEFEKFESSYFLKRPLLGITSLDNNQKLGYKIVDSVYIDNKKSILDLKKSNTKIPDLDLYDDMNSKLLLARELSGDKSFVKPLDYPKVGPERTYKIPLNDAIQYSASIESMLANDVKYSNTLKKAGLNDTDMTRIKTASNNILNKELLDINNLIDTASKKQINFIEIKIPETFDNKHPLNFKLDQMKNVQKTSNDLVKHFKDSEYLKNSELLKSQDVLLDGLQNAKNTKKTKKNVEIVVDNINMAGDVDSQIREGLTRREKYKSKSEEKIVDTKSNSFSFKDLAKEVANDIKKGAIKTKSFVSGNTSVESPSKDDRPFKSKEPSLQI